MKKIFVIGMLIFSSQFVMATEYLSNYAYYPIITKAAGSGGTNWLTETSITNPQNHKIVVRIHLAQNTVMDEWTLDIPAGKTYTWSDFMGDGLSRSGNAALYLRADEDDNPGFHRDCLKFASSVKVYNSGGASGTFGQEIPSSDSTSGFLGSWLGYFSGIKNYGTAGANGFRTNIGFWHTGYSSKQIRARIYNASGVKVWEEMITVERHKPYLMSVPITVQSGALVVDAMGEYADCAVYVSVVDNKSGDGAYRALTKVDPDDMATCGAILTTAMPAPQFDGPATENEAAERLHRLISGEPGVEFAD